MHNTPKQVYIFCKSTAARTCARAGPRRAGMNYTTQLVQSQCSKEDVVHVDEGDESGCTGHNYGIMPCNQGNTIGGVYAVVILTFLCILHVSL